jgi:hypothetical protein
VMIRARSLTWRWLSRRKSFREILTLSSFWLVARVWGSHLKFTRH